MSKMTLVGGLAVAVLAVFVVMQQQTISQLRQENETLKQQAAQVATLQAQAAQAAQDADVASKTAAVQETQAHELARLRSEAQVLRQQTNELAKEVIQARNDRDAAEVQAKDAQAAADTAVATTRNQPSAPSAADRETMNMNACINNLRLYDAAKQQWALENHKTSSDTPNEDDLRPYLGRGTNGELPRCPDGGVYTIGTVGEKPTCSVANHVLP